MPLPAYKHPHGEGAVKLAAGLCKNTTLRTLYLTQNPIGDSVKGAIAVAEMLVENKTLIRLEVDHCDINSLLIWQSRNFNILSVHIDWSLSTDAKLTTFVILKCESDILSSFEVQTTEFLLRPGITHAL